MQTTHQPRPNIADQLDRVTPRFDELTYRARLDPITPAELAELQELAHEVAYGILAPFHAKGRPIRLVNPPLVMNADRTSAGW